VKALVLSGGGAHGAYEAGVATALLQKERFDIICGVSIGAINAALMSAGRFEDALEIFWRREFPMRALQLFPHIPRLRRLIDHVGSIGHGNAWSDAMGVARAASAIPFLSRLGEMHKVSLRNVAGALGAMVDLSKLHTSMLAGATNASHASAVVFRALVEPAPAPAGGRLTEYRDLDADNFVMALLASSAMPGLFSPIELTFDGETNFYADGCIVHTSPLGMAIDNGATEVTVVFVDCERDLKSAPAAFGLAELAYNIATLWQQRLLDYELRFAQATNEIVRLGGAPGKREITIRSVRPESPLELDMLAFDDRKALARAFELGAADGTRGPRVMLPGIPAPEPVAIETKPGIWESLRRLFPSTAFKRSG